MAVTFKKTVTILSLQCPLSQLYVNLIFFFTITAEILARSLANLYCPLGYRLVDPQLL